jgi:hypothetical protein
MTPMQLGGMTTLLAGTLWMVAVVIMALRPPGIEGGPDREVRDLGIVMMASLLLLLLGLWALRPWLATRLGQIGQSAFLASAGGVLIAVLAGFAMAIGLEELWVLLVLGLLIVAVGSFLLGIAVLRSRAMPRSVAVFLIVGGLLFFGFNTEDARALFALPLGAAWAWLGYHHLTSPQDQPAT